MKNLKIILATMLFLSIVFAGAATPKQSTTANTSASYTVAPFYKNLPQKDIYNKNINYDKKYYLIDIWSITCPPCRETVPELVLIQDKYKAKSFTVLGFSLDTLPMSVAGFTEKMKVNYPIALLDDAQLNSFPPIRGIPTMFLLDNTGKILKTYIGYTDKKEFQKDLDLILK